MTGEFDARLDAAIARLTGRGGELETVGGDGAAVPARLPATLPDFFRHFCRRWGEAEAVTTGGERLSFARLDALSDRVAAALVTRWGVRGGDRVVIALRNAPAWIVAYMAIAKVGGIVVPVSGRWGDAELADALALTTPALVIADAERSIPAAARAVLLPADEPIEATLAPLLDGAGEGALPQVVPADDATILFTSGSTGRPRGAVSTHRAVTAAAYVFLARALAIRAVDPSAAAEVALVAVPLHHVTGAVALMLASVACGRRMVLMRRWDAGEALRLIECERVTYFSGPPTMGFDLMMHPEARTRDLSSLVEIVAGGAARPPAHAVRLAAAFPRAYPGAGYGLTESNAVGCSSLRGGYLARPASVGRAQRPFVEVAVLDGGEVAIRSAANARGYWGEAAPIVSAGGWLRTGDVGALAADGRLTLIGRAKDIVIRGGENIACGEIEAVLAGHDGVLEACAFPIADERLGEAVGAVVRVAHGIDAAGLSSFLGGRLARHKQPACIWIAEAPLPRLGSGKVDRTAVQRAYEPPRHGEVQEEATGAALPPSLSGRDGIEGR